MKKSKLFIVAILLSIINCSAQFTFVHITDLHVSDAISLLGNYDNNAVMFQCYIKHFANLNPKPAFIVATGDITNIGNSSPYGMYPTLTQYLFPGTIINPGIGAYFIDSTQTIPIYFTPGNHDYYSTLIPPATGTTLNYYPLYMAPDTDYALTLNMAVIVFLRSGYDDNRPFLQDPNIANPEGSGLSIAQCNWLRNVLSSSGSKRKIIVMHHPPVDAVGTNADGTPFTGGVWDAPDGSILNNRTTFLNICDSNKVDIVLAGHVHQNVVANRAGNVVSENWPDNTRYVQTSAAFQGSYRIITVDSAFVTVSPPNLCCTTTYDNELSNSINISVYPNPTSGTIEVRSEKLEVRSIEIYNLLGEKVYSSIINSQSSIIDLDAPNGIYLLKIKTDQGIANKKIVISKITNP